MRAPTSPLAHNPNSRIPDHHRVCVPLRSSSVHLDALMASDILPLVRRSRTTSEASVGGSRRALLPAESRRVSAQSLLTAPSPTPPLDGGLHVNPIVIVPSGGGVEPQSWPGKADRAFFVTRAPVYCVSHHVRVPPQRVLRWRCRGLTQEPPWCGLSPCLTVRAARAARHEVLMAVMMLILRPPVPCRRWRNVTLASQSNY